MGAPTPKPTNKPVPAPTPKPANPSGGSPWGSGCKAEWARCDGFAGDPNVCCDGLRCEDQGWGAQCKKDPNAKCLVNDLACTNKRDACCKGLKCKGNRWYAKCQ